MSEPVRPVHDPRLPPIEEGAVRRPARAQAEDPLAELARILGEGAAHPVRPEHVVEIGRRTLPSKPAPQQISDLEAELFESLRASVAPEDRVRGGFEREVPPLIPQHPVDDHDIASLRAIAAPQDGEDPVVTPDAAPGQETRFADYYAYDDGISAGSYDPAFAHAEAPSIDLDAAFAAEIHRARGGEPPRPTFDEFDPQAIAAAAREASPWVAEDPAILPHSMREEYEAARLPRESGGGFRIAAVVVAVLLAGGGALAGWKYMGRPGARGPVTIHADGEPLKILPDPTKATPSGDGGEVSLKRDTKVDGSKIVSLQEDPVEHVSGRAPDGREVRVINPGAQRPTASDQPRSVKTVVVRPDGSIVSEDGPAQAGAPATSTPPSVAVVPVVPIVPGQPAAPATAAKPGAPGVAAVPPIPTLPTPVAVAPTQPVAATPEVAPTAPAVPVPLPAARPAETAAPARPPVAAVPPKVQPAPAKPAAGNGAPLALGPVAPRLAPATPAPTRPAPAPAAAAPTPITPTASAAGDWAVQLSASKSEADARGSFAAAQRRYSALAGRSVEVQRADLGAKGTYYRARVPAGSHEAATALCGQIKAQGGDCIVTRR